MDASIGLDAGSGSPIVYRAGCSVGHGDSPLWPSTMFAMTLALLVARGRRVLARPPK